MGWPASCTYMHTAASEIWMDISSEMLFFHQLCLQMKKEIIVTTAPTRPLGFTAEGNKNLTAPQVANTLTNAGSGEGSTTKTSTSMIQAMLMRAFGTCGT